MKHVKFIFLVAVAIITTSCAELASFCTDVYNHIPLDNTGSTYRNYSSDEAMDIIMNTRAAQAWNQSATSKGLFLASVGLQAIEEISGRDFSIAKGIMDATIDDLLSGDNKAKSEKGNLIGAAFYGAGHIAGHYENKANDEYNAAFLEEHQDEMDETNPKYDKYFDCRYQIDETGRYVDVYKKYGMMQVTQCIREKMHEEAQVRYDSALAICAPTVTQDELDYLAKGSERDKIKRHKIIYDALRCFNEYKRSQQDSYAEADEMDYNEVIDIIDNIDTPIAEPLDNSKEKCNYSAKVEKLSDIEILEQTKVNAYKFNSYALSDDNKAQLDIAAEILQSNEDVEIEILGHSCDIGDAQANYTMGILRAKEAKKYLTSKGIDAKRIYVHSYGCRKPLVPNTSIENRAQNRRIEIKIIK